MIRYLFLFILSPFLFILSLIFGLVVHIKNLGYKFAFFKIKKLAQPVISVGNISVGGSGKTAVVLKILEQWPELCVLTRGYKSQASQNKNSSVLVKDSDHPRLYGDEPSLIQKKNPNTMIVIDADRYRGANFAIQHAEHQNAKITGFLLDDGFQYQKLFRDLNILLLDVEMYVNQPGLLPLGRFRENFSAVKRADHILLTKWQFHNQKVLDKLVAQIKKFNIDYDFLQTKISHVQNYKGVELNSEKVALVSGLGQPQVFAKDFAQAHPDVEIVKHFKYKDHHNYKTKDLDELLDFASVHHCDVVCSEKDYVKIQALKPGVDQIYYTTQELQIGESLTLKLQNLLKRD